MNVISIRRAEDELLGERDFAHEEANQGAQLKRLYGLLLRRWRVMLAVAIVLYAGVVAYTMLSPKVYTATALIMVNPAGQQVLSQEQSINNGSMYEDAAVESEIEVLTSYALSARLVREMHLDQDPEFNVALRPPSASHSLLAPMRELIGKITQQAAPTQAAAQRDPEATRDDIAAAVNGAVKAKRRGFSYVIEVSFNSRDPRRASEIVNRLTQVYLEMQTDARFEAAQRANDWLSHRLDELRQEVQAKEQTA